MKQKKSSVILVVALIGIAIIAYISLFIYLNMWIFGIIFMIPLVCLVKVGIDRIKEIEVEKDDISKY